jgi:hypothetical protein
VRTKATVDDDVVARVMSSKGHFIIIIQSFPFPSTFQSFPSFNLKKSGNLRGGDWCIVTIEVGDGEAA